MSSSLLTVLPPTHHIFNLSEQVIRDVADFQHDLVAIRQKELDALSKRLFAEKAKQTTAKMTVQPVLILIPSPAPNFKSVSVPLVTPTSTTPHQQQLLRRKQNKLEQTKRRSRGPPVKKVKLLDPPTSSSSKATATVASSIPLQLPTTTCVLPAAPPIMKKQEPMKKLEVKKQEMAAPMVKKKQCLQPVPFAFGFFFDPSPKKAEEKKK